MLRHNRKVFSPLGSVTVEMVMSVTILMTVFAGIIDLSRRIQMQNKFNQVGQEMEGVLRNSRAIGDSNEEISAAQGDVVAAVGAAFARIGESSTNYSVDVAFLAYELPNSNYPTFYVWIGLKGTAAIGAHPCVRLMLPIKVDYGDSYVVTPGTGGAGSGEYEFGDIGNAGVEETLNEFC